MLVDLHAKSSHTPGVAADVATVLRDASEAGLDAVAFCETLSTARCRDTLDAAADAGIKAFIGVEIPSDKGILIGFAPHIDDFYLAEEWRRLTEFSAPPAEQVIEMFEDIGGAVIAARPYDLSIPYNMGDLIFTLKNIHGVEVFNTRCAQVQCDFALEAAQSLGVSTCGGSDAKAIGKYATFFEQDFDTQEDFVRALRDSDYWAVQFGETPKPKRREPREQSDDRSGGRNGRDRGRSKSGGGRSGGGRGGSGGGRGGSGGGRGGSGGGRGGSGGGRRRD